MKHAWLEVALASAVCAAMLACSSDEDSNTNSDESAAAGSAGSAGSAGNTAGGDTGGSGGSTAGGTGGGTGASGGGTIDSGVNCDNAYFVAPDGVEGNPGTIDEPFASVQEAHDNPALQPGDVICLRGGTYHPTQRTRFNKAGTANDYIVLGAYPGELPIIDGGDVPEGDTDGGSTVTWAFVGAQYWKVMGPIQITNGRGAGVYIEDSQSIELDLVESSYNGKTAARGGHGFFIWGAGTSDILFRNCDGHHNANHLWKSGEDQLANQYQHGDGWRIFDGTNIRLEGCRAWHNLDDGYDFTQAPNPVEMVDCWAAYSAIDDAAGSITGTPDKPMPQWEGDGIKLGYNDDTGQHIAIRCLSWNNHCHGWTVRGGPYVIQNSAAFNNAEDAFFRHRQQQCKRPKQHLWVHELQWGRRWRGGLLGNHGSESDFVSLDDTGMLGPRQADGGLPTPEFLKLAQDGNLVDVGVDVGLSFEGSAPDIGPFELSQ